MCFRDIALIPNKCKNKVVENGTGHLALKLSFDAIIFVYKGSSVYKAACVLKSCSTFPGCGRKVLRHACWGRGRDKNEEVWFGQGVMAPMRLQRWHSSIWDTFLTYPDFWSSARISYPMQLISWYFSMCSAIRNHSPWCGSFESQYFRLRIWNGELQLLLYPLYGFNPRFCFPSQPFFIWNTSTLWKPEQSDQVLPLFKGTLALCRKAPSVD